VYVQARGNLSLTEKDNLVAQAEQVVLAHPGVLNAFAFAGEGGLDSNTGGATGPRDTIGQIQLETIAWEDRPNREEPLFTIPLINYTFNRSVQDEAFDGDVIIADLQDQLNMIPGIEKAGRFGADVAAVGGMVQLVTRGILLDTYTPAGAERNSRRSTGSIKRGSLT